MDRHLMLYDDSHRIAVGQWIFSVGKDRQRPLDGLHQLPMKAKHLILQVRVGCVLKAQQAVRIVESTLFAYISIFDTPSCHCIAALYTGGVTLLGCRFGVPILLGLIGGQYA